MRNNKQKNSWFNSAELFRISKLYMRDPLHSLEQLGYYLEDYPYDHIAYTLYARYLTELCKFDEAEKIISYIDSMTIGNPKFRGSSDLESTQRSDISLIVSKLQLHLHNKEYQEAFDLLKDKGELLNSDFYKLYGTKVFLQKKLNLPVEKEYGLSDKYFPNQILNYSEEKFFDHIQNHLYDDEFNEETSYKGKFYDEFPIKRIVEEIKKIIPTDKRFHFDLLTDTYIFRYDNCGKNMYEDKHKYSEANYFEVIAIHDTNKLITVYPVNHSNVNYYIDLNYLKDELDPKSVKKVSQIDKFNKRYNK